jgi:hypothetical protein
MIKEAIKKLVEKESLTSDEASAVMEEIMSGEATPSQLASFITALRMKGETADEIIGWQKHREPGYSGAFEEPHWITCGRGDCAEHSISRQPPPLLPPEPGLKLPNTATAPCPAAAAAPMCWKHWV